MLGSDDGDVDVFFDSVDSFSAQDCLLATKFSCDYEEIWVKEPVSVKERRERFLQGMGLTHASSKVCS